MNCLQCGKRIRNRRKDAVFCQDACKRDYHRNRIKNDTDNPAEKTIVSLCDYTGNWLKPYKEAGYHTVQIDLVYGQDVRLLRSMGKIYGLLAAPPCTMFAVAGNRWKRTRSEIREALSVVDACLRLVITGRPEFWALENPSGKLKQYLGKPAFRFDPCDYGDPYTKKTCLWGKFNAPKPMQQVKPIQKPSGHHSIDAYLKAQGYTLGKHRAKLRSMTPPGFAQAFFEVNQ